MCRIQWLLVAFLVVLGGNRIASANPPACPKLPPLWHGALCLAAGRYERSIAICDAILHSDTDNRCAYVLRGYAHLFKKEEDQPAIADFSEALRRGPDNAALHLGRAQAYAQATDYDRAIADCTAAIRIDPRYGEAYASRGGCYLRKRAINKAIADYSIALHHAPNLVWVRCWRGEVYRRRGEPARALADFEQVLRDDPNDKQAHYNRCLVYINLGDYDRVIAESSERIRRSPWDVAWYNVRSMAYLAKDETAKFLRDEATALSLKPANFHLHCARKSGSLFLGFSYGPKANGKVPWEDDTDERIAACTKRLASDPDNVAVYYERASAYHRKREYKQALADYEEIIRHDPSDAEAFRSRGYLHVQLGAYKDALDDYANAMRLDPDNADNYVLRARAYGALKKYKKALQDCTETLRLDPHCSFAYTVRGWVYAEIGDYAEAMADYKKVLQLDPQNRTAHNALGWHLATCPDVQLRNGKEALEHATTACEETKWKELGYLDTFAAACAECGDFDRAIEWQTRALQMAPEKDKASYRRRLDLYRSHQAYHKAAARSVSTHSSE